jgi:hypothetical protein
VGIFVLKLIILQKSTKKSAEYQLLFVLLCKLHNYSEAFNPIYSSGVPEPTLKNGASSEKPNE